MSEPIPESIPTSSDRRSHRPVKKARSSTPTSQQAGQVEALFANPDREIQIPTAPKAKAVLAPPEIVANVQGSSAGAGSGEFHVYKASRRREYERLRLMDEEVEREEKEKEWNALQEERRKADEEKLSKNQVKRAKQKARMEKKKKVGADGMDVDANGTKTKDTVGKSGGEKKRLQPVKISAQSNGNGERLGHDGGDTTENGVAHADEDGGGITFHDDD